MFASNFINIFRYHDEAAIPSGLILQWGNAVYRTEQKWPPNKPQGASIWRDTNGDGDYQADEFAPNIERVRRRIGAYHIAEEIAAKLARAGGDGDEAEEETPMSTRNGR